MEDNTFLGLQPYTEDDAYRFKGRTEESQELFRLIVRNNFTVCYAESGEGKTSLLNAGVFPLLRENMYFPIAITFTSDDYKVTPDSFDAIIDRCIKDSIAEYNEKNKGVNVEYKLYSTDFQGLDCQIDLQQELSKFSWWKLRNHKPQVMGLTFTPVFVFDQFEEVFNLPGSIVWTKKFFDWLEDVSSDSCPDVIVEEIREMIGDKAAFPTIKEDKGFKAVFSLRKEFIGELDYWGMQTHFIPALKDNRYCLKALTYEGAKKVMTQQERFDEDKVEQVLKHFVGQYSREPERTIAENLPAIPALLLSVVCDSWEKDMDTLAELDNEEIDQSLRKILEHFYNHVICSVVSDLSQSTSNLSSDQCRHDIETALFALVDSNSKRIRTKTTTANLTQVDFDAKYKYVLSDNRIIKITKIEGEDYVEIVHDSLCPIIAKRKEERLTAETKEREARLLREQAKKMRKRIAFFSILTVVFIGLLSLFLLLQRDTRYEREAKEAAQAQRDSIQELNKIVESQKNSLQDDSVLLVSHLEHILKDSLLLAGKNDSLQQQIIVNQQKDKVIERLEALSQLIINNKVAGKLYEQISPDLRNIATSITVSGQLNRTDIEFLRKMINNGSLKHIDIENAKIEKEVIGEEAFDNCSRLLSIKLPHNVTSIGDAAFSYCTGLTSVTIPNSVTSIGKGAFWRCSGLTSVTIPNSVTGIGDHAFSGCSGLISVTIPNSVMSIGDRAFSGCSGLTSVTIPNSVTSIGDGAFSICSGLTSVTISNSVTSIDDRVFSGCSGLASVIIPNSVTSIGDGAFWGCGGLASVTIPNSVTRIGERAFSGCGGLISVTIPNSVTSIGDDAFSYCTGLTSVTIPNSVTRIDDGAFSYCTGLTSVTIPNSVTSIGDDAFKDCVRLSSVSIVLTDPIESGQKRELLVNQYKAQPWWKETWVIKFKME